MGRSNNNTNIISTESGGVPAYLPSFPPVSTSHHPQPHHFQSNMHHQQLPSPPSSSTPLPHGHYLNLSNGPHLYETNNNIPPPARVYSPMSHGSNSSTGSFVSSTSNGSANNGNSNNNNGSLSIMDTISAGLKYEYEDFPQEPDGGPIKIGTWKEHVAVFSIDQVNYFF